MNYEELTEALKLISKTCGENDDCSICPLGDSNGECLISEENPQNWEIVDKQVVRLMK